MKKQLQTAHVFYLLLILILLIQGATSAISKKLDDDNNSMFALEQTDKTVSRNISNSYKGTWTRRSGSLYKSLTDSGLFSLNAKAEESYIGNKYHFIDGRVVVRDGVYLHNKFYQFMLHGVYIVKTGVFHYYLIPQAMVIKPITPNFNDSEANTVYKLGETPRIQKYIAQILSGFKLREDPTNVCIYKGKSIIEALPQQLTPDDPLLAPKKSASTSSQDASTTLLSINGEIEAVTSGCNNSMLVKLETWIIETFYARTVNYTLMITILAIFETLALIFQMNYTKTQTTAARVSLLMIGQQAMIDSYICLLHLTLGIFLDGVFKAFATAAFLKFVLFSIFEMRYLFAVWRARNPQAFSQGWNSMRRELQSLYTRFYGGLFIGLLIMYQFNQFFQYFLFILYSFWLPQVYCSATRDAPRPLSPVYIIVTSICRLGLPLYLFGCPSNFIGFEPSPLLCLLLIGWVFFQASILLLQNALGPRFCLPKLFLPAKYNYKRPVPQEQLEDGECNCVICMHAVDNTDCLVTPCNHVFHSECLQRWMEEKMECPSCRFSPLPEL